jgi:hypothetical protein
LEATETLTVVATADAAAVRHRRVVGGRGAVAPAAGGGSIVKTTAVAVSSVAAVAIVSTAMIPSSIVDATIVAGVTAIISIVIRNAGIYIRARNGHIYGTSGQKNREKKCE